MIAKRVLFAASVKESNRNLTITVVILSPIGAEETVRRWHLFNARFQGANMDIHRITPDEKFPVPTATLCHT